MSNAASDPPRYQRFADFYPVYLAEHADRTSRRLHFIGSSLALPLPCGISRDAQPAVAVRGPRVRLRLRLGRPFLFEHNRPATFRQPLFSLMGDWKMYWQTLPGRIPF